jgi:hypothetical protein
LIWHAPFIQTQSPSWLSQMDSESNAAHEDWLLWYRLPLHTPPLPAVSCTNVHVLSALQAAAL